jgi:hypothetical protein
MADYSGNSYGAYPTGYPTKPPLNKDARTSGEAWLDQFPKTEISNLVNLVNHSKECKRCLEYLQHITKDSHDKKDDILIF